MINNLFYVLYLFCGNREVKESAEKCLKEIKIELESFFENLNYEEEVQILQILIDNAVSKDNEIKKTTLEWINMFLNKYKFLFIQSSKLKSSYPTKISFNNTANNMKPGEFNLNFKLLSNFNLTNITNTSNASNNFIKNPTFQNSNSFQGQGPLSHISPSPLCNSGFFNFNNLQSIHSVINENVSQNISNLITLTVNNNINMNINQNEVNNQVHSQPNTYVQVNPISPVTPLVMSSNSAFNTEIPRQFNSSDNISNHDAIDSTGKMNESSITMENNTNLIYPESPNTIDKNNNGAENQNNINNKTLEDYTNINSKNNNIIISNKNNLKIETNAEINNEKESSNDPKNMYEGNLKYKLNSNGNSSQSFLDEVNYIILIFGKEAEERKIPFHLFPKVLQILFDSINLEYQESILDAKYLTDKNHIQSELEKIDECNENLLSIIEFYSDNNTANIKLFEHILKKFFQVKNNLLLKKVLLWISKLFKKFHEDMFIEINDFINDFTELLIRENDIVFNSVLDILCEISKYKDEYIEIIIRQILQKLALNIFLLQNRATKIIKNFCNIIEINRVYVTFAEELKNIKVIFS